MIQSKPVNYVLDADIKGFFDHMDHEWIIRFIESKIKDPNITRLVRRMLKAGIMKDYQVRGHRRRKWAGLCMLTNHLMYIHALCADMVVPRESAAKPERICRISELCR